MEAFLVATGVVAIAEIGDKTQLLALLLAARFRQTWPIVAGILLATLANHFLAGAVGAWLAAQLNPTALRWGLGLAFLAVAVWALAPDEMDEDEAHIKPYGALLATGVAFFLAEMGDKTQVATVMLAVKYQPLWQVVLGTTAGMMLANAPAVWLGQWLGQRMLWLRRVRFAAAAIFAVLGLAVLSGAGQDSAPHAAHQTAAQQSPINN